MQTPSEEMSEEQTNFSTYKNTSGVINMFNQR